MTHTLPLASPSRCRSVARGHRARRTEEVLDQLDRLGPDERCRREELIEELIVVNMGLARSVAARYRNRGIDTDDLEQVAYVALVRVAGSYDHSSGCDFASYAVPSIRGEVRRHFRDRGWMVRPPRRVQENQARISAVESPLATQLGHPPTAADLARELEQPEKDVQEALSADGCFRPTSLDQVMTGGGTRLIGEQLGHLEKDLEAADARILLAPAISRLSKSERVILEMRFSGDCTQQQIADEVGASQMQVSRLLGRLLTRLRAELEPSEMA